MGSCTSILSSADKIAKDNEIKGGQEIEETPVVEIYIKCPSPTISKQSMPLIRQATETTVKVSSSIELKDIESVDEFLSNKSSVLSVNDCDVVLSQKEVLEVRGELPRIRQHCNVWGRPNTACSKESHLERGNNCDDEVSRRDKELPGASGIHNLSSLPPPRPSLWKEFYLKRLKSREKLADKYMKKKSQKHPKKKNVSQVKKKHSLRILSFKKIQKSIRRKRAAHYQRPCVITHVQPVNKDLTRIYHVGCNGNSNDSSSSVSPASTSSPSNASRNRSISIPSDGSFEGLGKRECGKGVGKRKQGVVKSCGRFERSKVIKKSQEQAFKG